MPEHLFTVGELWGPFPCEEVVDGNKCGIDCFSLVLTDTEVNQMNTALPDEVICGMARGPEAVRYIFKQKLGKALCDRHLRASIT